MLPVRGPSRKRQLVLAEKDGIRSS
jgi:hypothetical protein